MITFGGVPLLDLDLYWPVCKRILSPAFNTYEPLSQEDYFEKLKTNHMQLWAAVDDGRIIGAVITSIDNGSAMKICVVMKLSGKRLKDWALLADNVISDFANINNCDAIQYVGREGFERVFPSLERDGVIFVRILKNEQSSQTVT